MDTIGGLPQGFDVALTWSNLSMCFVGVLLGMDGVLPGLGRQTIAMLLPLTLKLEPTGAMIGAGIYYGAKYGGSTTVLLNVPGESASVVNASTATRWLARAVQVRRSAWLRRLIRHGTFGVIAGARGAAAADCRRIQPEYFALMVPGHHGGVASGESPPGAGRCCWACGSRRWAGSVHGDFAFHFGQTALLGGIAFVIVAIGIFAIGEVLANMEPHSAPEMLPVPKGLRNLLPTWEDMKACRFAFLNGSLVGFIVGILPGAGSTIASFLSYGIEKAVSKHPEQFGHGAIEGVAAPEGANNAETGGATRAFADARHPRQRNNGGPARRADPVGLRRGRSSSRKADAVLGPGREHVHRQRHAADPQFAAGRGVRAAIEDARLRDVSDDPRCLAGRRLQRFLEYFRARPARDLRPARRYGMRKLDFPNAPLVLGLVLGDAMEKALRQSLMMSQGHISILFRPIPAVLLAVAAVLLIVPLFKKFNAMRVQVLDQEAP
jgi:putative tricarboxylic transport membrane protein